VSGAAWAPAGAMGMLTAVMIAGLFEYNFGDSEVLLLVLLATAIPYSLRRSVMTT
jgi:hypothetical protein